VAALTVSIVVAFAQRAIAVTCTHLGESLLTWLVNVAFALATSIALVMGVLGVLVVPGGVGALAFALAGLSAPPLAFVGFIAAVLTMVGVANTFFRSFWTLAYLRLSGRAVSTTLA
jgi:hypothetical protein